MQSLFNQITAGTVNVTGNLTLNGNSVLTGFYTGDFFSDSFSANIKTVTGNYNFTNSDYAILFSGNNLTGTLPSASNYSGLIYQIKLITGSVILTGSQNIDNSNIYSSFSTDKGICLQSDGNQWWVINHSPTGLLTGSFYPLLTNPSGYLNNYNTQITGSLNITPSLLSGGFTLGLSPFYVYTGTGLATWNLPTINTSTGRMYFLKNRGNTLTITGAGSDQIFADTNYNSFSILSGQAFIVANDGNFWSLM